MRPLLSLTCTAFADAERVASGAPRDVVLAVKTLIDAGDPRTFLVFDDATAEPVEFDLRGSVQETLKRLEAEGGGADADAGTADADTGTAADLAGPGHPRSYLASPRLPRTPGRPRLGVVGREVTLLPRHWEWLNAQPGGASVALRKLVDQARRANEGRDRVRRAQEVTFRFTSAMAGNDVGFEEASRALFAGDGRRFEEHTEAWPPDVRAYALSLSAPAFAGGAGE